MSEDQPSTCLTQTNPPAWQTRLLIAAAIVAIGAPIALNPPQPRLTGHVTPNETRQP